MSRLAPALCLKDREDDGGLVSSRGGCLAGCFLGQDLGGLELVFFPAGDEDLFKGRLMVGLLELLLGGQGLVVLVDRDVLDGVCGRGGETVRRQVVLRDLQPVEQQAGAARVKRARRDAGQDLGQGKLQGGAVFEGWNLEGGGAGRTSRGAGCRVV